MPATPTYALPYPASTDPADVPADVKKLADRIEVVVGPGTANGQIPVWDNAAKKWVAAARELAYAQIVANVSLTGSGQGNATTIVTAPAVTFDGATPVYVDFFAPLFEATVVAVLVLFEDGVALGNIAELKPSAASNIQVPAYVRRKITPTAAAHTYSIRGYVGGGTAQIAAGNGGAGFLPAFIRIERA